MSILGDIGPRSTPQTEQAHPGQRENNADGYTFTVSDWDRLARFLVLGVDEGTYYVQPRELAVDNAAVVAWCLDADPRRTVDLACDISVDGRAPKNDPAIFVLAMAAAHPQARDHALARLGDVCRIGTHLFHFARFVQAQRGWGRSLRRAIARWYERDDLDGLAYQAVKYRQRDGWTHRDLLRKAHPTPPTPGHDALYAFICGRYEGDVPRVVEGYRKMVEASDPDEAAALIGEYNLPWETVPSELMGPKVWAALLDGTSLPLGALVRNLGTMTANSVLTPATAHKVTARLADADAIRKARLHPIAVLNAQGIYAQGHGLRGGLTWTPVSKVVDALDGAFYSAFKAVEPAGKRTLVAVDVSGSMRQAIAGCAFDARTGAGAMALVTAATEPDVTVVAFSNGPHRSRWSGYNGMGSGITPVDVSPRRRLDDNLRALDAVPMGGTDCALPMLWALESKVPVDTFVVLTDNETWAGQVHPHQALTQYRQQTGIAAKLIVVGMTATEFTIADPNDPGQLDVVGFDTAAPGVMSAFSAGRF